MEVHPLPLVQLTPQSATACGSATLAFFNDLSNTPGSDFAWSFGDGATSSSEIIAHTYSQSGNYLVILQVTSTYGCVNADSTNVAITVNPRAVADFSTNMNEVSEFNPTVNFFNTSTNTSSVQWFFGDGNGSTTFNPSHEYSGTGTYNVTLIANNAFNCPDTATQEIIVRPEFTFYIPNAFTPDGDGKNDVFNGKGTNIAEYEMLIFNRWGELVFSTNSLDYSWDGTYKASTEPLIDVYVYKVKIKDSDIPTTAEAIRKSIELSPHAYRESHPDEDDALNEWKQIAGVPMTTSVSTDSEDIKRIKRQAGII
jgi:gliding motility-associated-like protein